MQAGRRAGKQAGTLTELTDQTCACQVALVESQQPPPPTEQNRTGHVIPLPLSLPLFLPCHETWLARSPFPVARRLSLPLSLMGEVPG